jgi:hypothetical protein
MCNRTLLIQFSIHRWVARRITVSLPVPIRTKLLPVFSLYQEYSSNLSFSHLLRSIGSISQTSILLSWPVRAELLAWNLPQLNVHPSIRYLLSYLSNIPAKPKPSFASCPLTPKQRCVSPTDPISSHPQTRTTSPNTTSHSAPIPTLDS